MYKLNTSKKIAGKLALSTLALLASSAVQAELLQYAYTSTSNEAVEQATSNKYISSTGPIDFYSNTGIDRKVKLSLLDTSGESVAERMSETVGSQDRINVGGKVYYGTILSLPTPEDGIYKVKEEIYTSEDTPLRINEHEIIIDTTPPSKGEWSIDLTHGWKINESDNVWKIGGKYTTPNPGNMKRINVTDLSGLKKATVTSYQYNGGRKGEKIKSQELGIKGNTIDFNGDRLHSFFANGRHDTYLMVWEIEDNAGNIRTIEQPLRYDDYRGYPSAPVAVKTGTSKDNDNYLGLVGFTKHINNIAIENNPYQVIWEIPKSNWHEYDIGGLRYTNGTVVKKTEDNVYVRTTCIYGNVRSCGRVHDAYTWGNNSIERATKVSLGENATSAPKVTKLEFLYSDIGWGNKGRAVKSPELPVSINKIRISTNPSKVTQVATFPRLKKQCEIPAGQTSCEVPWDLEMLPNTAGYNHTSIFGHANIYIKDNPVLKSDPYYASGFWNDQFIPEVTDIRYPETAVVEATVNFPQVGNYQNKIRMGRVVLLAGDKTITGTKISSVDKNRVVEYKFDLSQLSDGEYSNPVIRAYNNTESYNEAKVDEFVIDTKPPVITFNQKANADVESIDEIIVGITDTVDASPEVIDIEMRGGPANDRVQLAWREDENGFVRLEYPVMFPSMEEGEGYELTVTATDRHRNEAKKTLLFNYKPRTETIKSSAHSDGVIRIPASTHTFRRQNGNETIESEPLTLSDGSTVSGTYEVTVTLRSDSEMPLRVNGARIEPGETKQVMTSHNFALSGGRLSLPVSTIVDGDIGRATLLINTIAPNAPTLIATVESWQPAAELKSDNWEIRQIVDEANIFADKATGSLCEITADETFAKESEVYEAPLCYLEWDETLSNVDEAPRLVRNEQREVIAAIPQLKGSTTDKGEKYIRYSLFLFDNGEKVKVGGGEKLIDVQDAYGSIEIAPRDRENIVISRKVEEVQIRMAQTAGTKCTLTTSEDVAISAAERNSNSGRGRITCLVEWVDLPNGLHQKDRSLYPEISGHANTEAGESSITWQISSFTQYGEKVLLNEQVMPVEIVDPPKPKITLNGAEIISNGSIATPQEGGYIGLATFEVVPSIIEYEILRDGTVIDSGENRASGSSKRLSSFYRRVNADERALGTITQYVIKARYKEMPEQETTEIFEVVSVPNSYIKPRVEIPDKEILNIETLPVEVSIYNRRYPQNDYDITTMGDWEVRLVKQMAFGKVQELAPYTDINSEGKVTFEVNITGEESSSLRISAQARLKTNIPDYERIEQSALPAYVSVLYGDQIQGDIQANRISGESPLTSTFKYVTESLQVRRAIGTVTWEISSDGGVSWQEHEGSSASQLRHTFDQGDYLVRAKVTNKNSGKISTSSPVELLVYDKLNISINGPNTMFVGSEGEFVAEITKGGEAVASDEVDIEWSLDGGKTFDHAGESIKLHSLTQENIRLAARVKAKNAPEEDRYAYTMDRTTVSFRQVKPPFIRIKAPARMEEGETYILKAETRIPYRGMQEEVVGAFTLPNGDIVEGDEITYTPSKEVLAEGSTTGRIKIEYTARIKGYPESETTKSRNVRVWQYVFPNFALHLQSRAKVAPAEVTANVRAIGFFGELEEPQYEWIVPDEGIDMQDTNRPTTKTLTINKAGKYEVKVIVTDARGHRTELIETIEIGEAEPWNIDIEYRGSNNFDREPLNVSISPRVTGGHTQDRVVERLYFINGQLLEDEKGSSARTTLYAGINEIVVQIRTKMGQSEEGRLEIDIKENEPPVCDLQRQESTYSWRIRANCTDPDGRVAKYHWWLNGEKLRFSSYNVTINKSNYETMPSIKLIAEDDAGAESIPVTLF